MLELSKLSIEYQTNVNFKKNSGEKAFLEITVSLVLERLFTNAPTTNKVLYLHRQILGKLFLPIGYTPRPLSLQIFKPPPILDPRILIRECVRPLYYNTSRVYLSLASFPTNTRQALSFRKNGGEKAGNHSFRGFGNSSPMYQRPSNCYTCIDKFWITNFTHLDLCACTFSRVRPL